MGDDRERKRRGPFISWLSGEIRKKDRSVQQIAEKSGIHFSTFSRWISGQTEPDAQRIGLLAEYFGVERKYIYDLLGRTEPTAEEEITEEERAVLRLYRGLATYDRSTFTAMIEAFARSVTRDESSGQEGE